MHIYLSIYLCNHISIYLSTYIAINPSMYLFIEQYSVTNSHILPFLRCISIYAYLYIYPFIHLSIYRWAHSFTNSPPFLKSNLYLSIHPSIYLFISQYSFINSLSIYLSIYQSLGYHKKKT